MFIKGLQARTLHCIKLIHMKGQKTGGRKAGSLNKATAKIKDAYSQLLENNLETLQDDLNSLKPLDRLRFMLDLSEYVIPKLARTEADITTDGERLGYTDQEIDNKINDLLRKIADPN